MLVFNSQLQVISHNDTLIGAVAGITFGSDAGAFVLSGNGFDFKGTLENLSLHQQRVENDLRLTAATTVHTNGGTLVLDGAISASGAAALTKTGSGTLIFSGANTYTGGTVLGRGRVLLDVAAGGSLAAGGRIMLGANAVISSENSGGVFEVKGASGVGETTVNLGVLYLANSGGHSRVVVDSNGGAGTEVVFSAYDSYAIFSRALPTLHFQLSTPGAEVRFVSSGNFLTGAPGNITVHDGVKSGFATLSSGSVVRQESLTQLPDTIGNVTMNYRDAGVHVLTGHVRTNTLTLTGAGELSGSYHLKTGGLLMEEGVGDYTMKVRDLASSDRGALFFHQFSTEGTLRVESNLISGASASVYTNNSIAKTGAGRMVFTGRAEHYAGVSDFQGGEFVLDGSLEATSAVQVRAGATLSGSGTIGGGMRYEQVGSVVVESGTRYTPVRVHDGGTLVGGGGMTVHGSLQLDAGATFEVSLTTGTPLQIVKDPTLNGSAVTLGGNLKLSLSQAPVGDEVWRLVETDTSDGFLGVFATINGVAVGSDHLFSLEYGGDSYLFEIGYLSDAVLISAQSVPEPGVGLLLLGGCAGVILGSRYRRKSLASL